MVKTDKTIIAILDKIEGMERQKENFSTTIFGTFQQRMLFFQQKKLSLLSLLSLKQRKKAGWGHHHSLPPFLLRRF